MSYQHAGILYSSAYGAIIAALCEWATAGGANNLTAAHETIEALKDPKSFESKEFDKADWFSDPELEEIFKDDRAVLLGEAKEAILEQE